MKQRSYHYRSLSIPGGGFVTGFVFHPRVPGILYARTDVGGIYRYQYDCKSWTALTDWAGGDSGAYMQVLSLALDADRPGRLFALCGNAWKTSKPPLFPRHSALLFSEDYGETFQIRPVPFAVNGNGPMRSCAEKLCFADGVLYYASPQEGLFCSGDLGESWEPIPVPNPHLVFVHADAKRHWILLASTGEPFHDEEEEADDTALPPREHSLYLAANGFDFQPLPMPEWNADAAETPQGFAAVSFAVSEQAGSQTLYVTFSGSGRANPFQPYANFACDCGGGTQGKLYRYTLSFDSGSASLRDFADITPPIPTGAGMGGVAVSGSTVFCSTINERYNFLYRSADGGSRFEQILNPGMLDAMDFDVPYMKPAYNNGTLLLHWMSCLAVDPFRSDFLLINTGTGIFASFSACQPCPRFTSLCHGVEETVHLNLYAPPCGPVRVLDIVGDLGGFAFRNLDSPCENSFADPQNHRYITCNNADFTDTPVTISHPTIRQTGLLPYIATARGNWTGHTKGGLILSLDDCASFHRLPMPYGIHPALDKVCQRMEHPNVNAGWCAMSCDGRVILWTLASWHFRLPIQNAVRTEDYGAHYEPVRVYDCAGAPIPDPERMEIKFFADRTQPDWFYGFGEHGQIYQSTDKGRHFYELETPEDFPKNFYFSGVDGMKRGEIRCESEKSGSVWIACEYDGLWHLSFDKSRLHTARISSENESVFRVGLGKGRVPHFPALYICGTVDGVYGLFRKDSPDADWIRINTDQQQYGNVTSLSGDPKLAGRVYIATNARGAFWGEPV